MLLCMLLTLSAHAQKSTREQLDGIFGPLTQKRNSCIVIVTVNKDVVNYYCYGSYKDKISGQQLIPDAATLFDIASVGKLFTATLLKMLAAEGGIDLYAPIAPNFKEAVSDLTHFDDISYHDLINHTSGLPALPGNALKKMQTAAASGNPYALLTTRDIYDYLETCENRKAKGKERYSNLGYGLIGISLSLREQLPFDTIMYRGLFSKIGMEHTFVPAPGIFPEQLIPGYTARQEPAAFWHDTVLPAAGSFVSNAEDMSRFLLYSLGQFADVPLTGNMEGWIYAAKILNRQAFYWHNGMSGGYYSFIAVDTLNKTGMAILSNQSKALTFQQYKAFEIVRSQQIVR